MEDLDDNLQALRDAGVKVSTVLGFNEPNHAEQADMSPRCLAAHAFPNPLAPALDGSLEPTVLVADTYPTCYLSL